MSDERASQTTLTASRWRNLIGWVATFAVAGALAGLVLWMGVALNTVTTDSMTPTLQPNDMVLTVSPQRKAPHVGDVIVFEAQFYSNHIPPHVHRIVGVEPNGDWITQGDKAHSADPWRVHPGDVTGIMLASLSRANLITPLIVGLGAFILILVFAWPRASDDDDDTSGPTDQQVGVEVSDLDNSTPT